VRLWRWIDALAGVTLMVMGFLIARTMIPNAPIRPCRKTWKTPASGSGRPWRNRDKAA
jgi:Ni,Fe-hydrogenase I cytochrome b subunit